MSDHGEYLLVEGRPVIRFERRLARACEEVWAALTDPAQLAHWFPQPVQLELRVGAALRFGGEGEDGFDGEILEVDPPRLLAYAWGTDPLRFELVPDGDRTRLFLMHILDLEGEPAAARTLAGWHVCLDGLERHLDGQPGRGGPGWREYYENYRKAGAPWGAPIPGGD